MALIWGINETTKHLEDIKSMTINSCVIFKDLFVPLLLVLPAATWPGATSTTSATAIKQQRSAFS